MYEDTYGCIRTEIIHQLLPKALFDPNSIVGVSTGPLVGIGQAFEVMFFSQKNEWTASMVNCGQSRWLWTIVDNYAHIMHNYGQLWRIMVIISIVGLVKVAWCQNPVPKNTMVTSNNIINTTKMPGTSWTTPTCLPVKLLFVQSVWIASKSLGTQQDFDVPVDCLHKKNVILPATVCKSRCNVQEACVGLTVPEMLGGWRWIHQMEVVSGLFQEQGRTRRYMDWQVKEFHFKVVLVVCVWVRDDDLGRVFFPNHRLHLGRMFVRLSRPVLRTIRSKVRWRQ